MRLFGGISFVFINTGMESEDNDKVTYAIGDVAGRLGVSVETIRLYERQGLIIVAKSEKGQRVYSEQDIERLKCVRNAITELKISIEGIRRMQSTVPCWSHIQCPDDQRQNCPAFLRASGGCWTYKHDGNKCAGLDCRSCKVYVLSGTCENIKTLIYKGYVSTI